jgi:hypothetical protein
MLRQLGHIITTMLQRVNVSKNPKENNVNRTSVYVGDNITILNLVSHFWMTRRSRFDPRQGRNNFFL